MTTLTKNQALGVIRRAYGPDRAELLAERLPARVDVENPADRELLFQLGLTRCADPHPPPAPRTP